MPDLPTGTVTFLFTDIEGSTRRWESEPTAMSAALARHDQLVREAIQGHGGQVFKTVGVDAAYYTFPAMTSIASGAYYLVGGTAYKGMKDGTFRAAAGMAPDGGAVAIKNGNTGEIYQMMSESGEQGMVTMEQDLKRLYLAKKITLDVAMNFANNKRRLQQILNLVAAD